jgi:CheY-like chemotaxis protein
MGNKTRILIVEDEEKIAYTLARALRRASDNDFTVEIQNAPLDAINLFKTQEFDLLITDQRMPGMSGLELIAHVRREYPETRAILITGFGSPEIEAEARRLANGYLTKPFNLPDVLDLVQDVIRDPHSGAGAQAVIVENGLNEIKHCLDDLYMDTGATYVMLLDMDGHTLIDRGDPGAVEHSMLNSLLCSSMTTSGELERAFKDRHAFDTLHYNGDRYEIYLRKVNERSLLALLLDLDQTSARMGAVRIYLKRAVAQIREQKGFFESSPPPKEPIKMGSDFGRLLDAMLDENNNASPSPVGVASPASAGSAISTAPATCAEPVPVEPSRPSDPAGNEETISLEEAIRRGIVKNWDLP